MQQAEGLRPVASRGQNSPHGFARSFNYVLLYYLAFVKAGLADAAVWPGFI